MRVDEIEFQDALSPDILDPESTANNMRRMGSLHEMILAMILHACPRKSLVVFNNQKRLLVGYACSGCNEAWGVAITLTRKWNDGIRRLMGTSESRVAISTMVMACSSIQEWNEMMASMTESMMFEDGEGQ